ncbi:hypothetical protein CC85DRAFT_302467 [Cutaneotrichosporon oleaginosum]|uniref:C4-dicarboxylate transporter/malic acid transport protein n=1 Tax=Cutaneotrichosporon oleaginosum TaxID=879819 RepID=A0A0J0XMF9_9TREE|nr:uncharacterized protein CC85DRAFT_302467 [Cutaneotrichosporon oleaginosum]KLT42262.1 hypothetical protein CC85DRAFT_302467 [Cutaneotrichosporon oleaginosum]TXT11434.1 hypothetical protein COLE_01844 [Cutaneotrichosporon oleaginosum]
MSVSISTSGSTMTAPHGIAQRLAHAALHTPPSFFSINMGTGITSILLHNFPYRARWLEMLGTIVFVLNVAVFVLLLGATIARYSLWPVWRTVARHKVAGMFWGCFPMGFATIVNMVCLVCVPAWGARWAYTAYAMWWADVLVSLASNLGMLWMVFTRQEHTLATLAPTWLLPVVATVVAAASGGVVAEALVPINPALARSTLYVSWIIWGTGVPIALMVIALLIYRFAAGGPPAPAALASVFLPLGPCGQGSFGITTLGVVARALADRGTPMVPASPEAALRIADGMYAACLLAGLVLWGLALAWYILAVAMFVEGVRRDPALLGVGKFTLGLWALTFPIGVWATASIALAAELDSPAMRVIAAVISAQVIFHWCYVAAMTAWKLVRGELFAAPELEGKDVLKRWETSEQPDHDHDHDHDHEQREQAHDTAEPARRQSLRDMFRRPSNDQPARRGSWRDMFSGHQQSDQAAEGTRERRSSWKDVFHPHATVPGQQGGGERHERHERRGSWKDVFHKDHKGDEATNARILGQVDAMDTVPGAEEATAARADPAVVGETGVDTAKVMGGGRHMGA